MEESGKESISWRAQTPGGRTDVFQRTDERGRSKQFQGTGSWNRHQKKHDGRVRLTNGHHWLHAGGN